MVLLRDTKPEEEEDLIVAERPKGECFYILSNIEKFAEAVQNGVLVFGVGEEDEPAPPQPFRFTR